VHVLSGPSASGPQASHGGLESELGNDDAFPSGGGGSSEGGQDGEMQWDLPSSGEGGESGGRGVLGTLWDMLGGDD